MAFDPGYTYGDPIIPAGVTASTVRGVTPGDIIKLALKMSGVVGVGQTALAEDTNDTLALLNMMIAQWSAKRYLVFHLIDTACMSTGAESYSIGAGGLFNIPRPQQIEYAYARLNPGSQNPIDYPLEQIPSYEDYATISLKLLSTFPSSYFYDAAYPVGTIHFWPIPGQVFELHILTKATLSAFTNLTTAISLAPEYQDALLYNLAARLRPMYGMQPDQTITAFAKASLATIRLENAQIPLLRMPDGMPTGGGARYNIYSDQGG